MNPIIRTKLIAAGVRNLKKFGYPEVTEENILTDQIYSAFFSRMLEDHEGPGEEEAKAILSEISPDTKNNKTQHNE